MGFGGGQADEFFFGKELSEKQRVIYTADAKCAEDESFAPKSTIHMPLLIITLQNAVLVSRYILYMLQLVRQAH